MSMVHGTSVFTFTPDDPESFVHVDMYYLEDEGAEDAYYPWKAGRPHGVIDDGILNKDGNVEIVGDPVLFVTPTPAGVVISAESYVCIGRIVWERDGQRCSEVVIGTRDALSANGALNIRRLEGVV